MSSPAALAAVRMGDSLIVTKLNCLARAIHDAHEMTYGLGMVSIKENHHAKCG